MVGKKIRPKPDRVRFMGLFMLLLLRIIIAFIGYMIIRKKEAKQRTFLKR